MTEHQAPWPDGEVLAGIVERVTFHNAESGFAVLRVKARGHRDLVTIVGHAAAIAAGEWITAAGEWVNDRTHGQQFKARFLKTSAPTTAEGIERYLGSGMIRGIGPVYAKKLVRGFGEAVFDIIEGAPQRLREVGGIGEVRLRRIVDAWAEQKVIREIMVFLHSHGVGTVTIRREPRCDCGAVVCPRRGGLIRRPVRLSSVFAGRASSRASIPRSCVPDDWQCARGCRQAMPADRHRSFLPS